MQQAVQYDPGSFRDRSNRVFVTADAAYRTLDAAALDNWCKLQTTRFYKKLAEKNLVVRTEEANLAQVLPAEAGRWAGVLKHELIPVISYPYEWSFGMLKTAALLHLDMMRDAIAEGFILKDATPYNIQWVGAQPKLIDIVSFEPLGNETLWVAHRQFCELFLYPLMLQAYRKIPFQSWLRGSLDGIPVSDMAGILSFRDYFRKGVFTQVKLQNIAQKGFGGSTSNIKKELQSSNFGVEMLKANVASMRNIIESLDLGITSTEWGDYTENLSYTDAEYTAKKAFIANVLSEKKWPLVWDLGCNTGDFSRIAAQAGSYVVAVDADHLAVERLFQKQYAAGSTSILPVIQKVNDLSPGTGWRGKERAPFVSRSKPTLIFALALIHHLVITANIPLREVLSWMASLNASLIIEFVAKSDEMVQQLLRHRVDQYDDYTPENFEKLLGEFFEIKKRQVTKPGKRELFFATTRF